MKFTDGYWLTKEEYKINHPYSVRDFEISNDSLILYGPCKNINHRGDTLNIPLITTKITSIKDGIVRIQSWHHKGIKHKQPNFELNVLENKTLPLIDYDENEINFYSGNLRIRVIKNDFLIEFYQNDKNITHINNKGLAWIRGLSENYMRAQINIGVGEKLYGLGERFTPFVKNGQEVNTWNKDGGTSSEQAYKNIPFYVSNKGYGILANHPENVSFELGSESVSKSQFSVKGEEIDFYFINGPDLKQVLTHYSDLTGKPSLPPAWSYGLWLSTSFTTNYDEETVNHFVDEMHKQNIPISVFHFDCFWMKEFEWSSFEWDEKVFPNPERMLKRLKDKGLKICVWINPYIAQKSPLFDEAVENDFLIKKCNGDIWQWDFWQSGMGIVDFTNPAACNWYAQKLKRLLKMGVDSFKTDFGERIPTNVSFFDKSDPQKMHNYYSYKYNEIVFNLLKEEKGEKEAIVFARSATVGSQKFPVHWGGDCEGTYESMAESLRGGLSLALSGFGFWSHDIGGFETLATPDLFKRWIAFGLLSSHSRLHGSDTYRVPWKYDEESTTVTSFFTRLKNRLMPYIYSKSVISSTTGLPTMRPMLLEFSDDLNTHTLDTQYMLGDSILVAPIFNKDGIGIFYLPNGKWTHLLTGRIVEGGKWFREWFNYFSLPVFVKENTILPLGSTDYSASYNYAENVTFNVYQLNENVKAISDVYDTYGEKALSLSAVKRDNKITFSLEEGNTENCFILLHGFNKIKEVSNDDCVLEVLDEGIKIAVPKYVHKLTVII